MAMVVTGFGVFGALTPAGAAEVTGTRQQGTPLVTTSTPTVSVGASSGGSSTTAPVATLPPNDPLCRAKPRVLVQLERERSRAVILLTRSTARLERALRTSRPAVVAAFQKEVRSNAQRVDEIVRQVDLLNRRCPERN